MMEKVTLLGTFGFCFVCAVLELSRANAIYSSPSLSNANATKLSVLQSGSTINGTMPRQSPGSLDFPGYPPHRYPSRPKHPPFLPPNPEERRPGFWSFLNPVQAFKKLVEIISGEGEEDLSSKPTRTKYPYAQYRRRPPSRPTPSYSNPPTTPAKSQTTEEAVTLSYEDQSKIIDQIVSSLTTESAQFSQVRPGNYGYAPVQPSFPSTFPTTASKFVTLKAPMTTPPPYNAAVPSYTSYAPTITVTPSYTRYKVPKLPAITPSVPVPGTAFPILIPLLASGVLP